MYLRILDKEMQKNMGNPEFSRSERTMPDVKLSGLLHSTFLFGNSLKSGRVLKSDFEDRGFSQGRQRLAPSLQYHRRSKYHQHHENYFWLSMLLLHSRYIVSSTITLFLWEFPCFSTF
jgi:hypothetical protein